MGWWERRAESQQRKAERANELLGGDDWVSKVDGPPTPFSRATVAYLQAKAVLFGVAMLILVVVGVIALFGAGM
jgi:hypothetical protein